MRRAASSSCVIMATIIGRSSTSITAKSSRKHRESCFPAISREAHAREPGAKGATVVTVQDNRITDVDAITLDAVRWMEIPVTISGAVDQESALAMTHAALAGAVEQTGGRLLIARVVLHGTPLHAALSRDPGAWREKVRAEALSCAGHDAIWIERVTLATRPRLEIAQLRSRSDATGLLVRAIEEPARPNWANP
jgi:exonuclease SbcD